MTSQNVKFIHLSTAVGLNCVTEKTFVPLNKNSITGCNQITVRIQQRFRPFIEFLRVYLHTQGLTSSDVKSLTVNLHHLSAADMFVVLC